jgi:signal transduction histidine kinase
LARQLPADSSHLQDRVQDLDSLLENTMKAVRRISEALPPAALDQKGLAGAITENVKQFQATTGLRCEVSIPPGEPALPAATSAALFRILQEALTNVARHAQATRVDIRLTDAADSLVLEIRDDGRGITNAARDRATGLGLLGMKERALEIGADVAISGRPGEGTTVVVTVPAGNAVVDP